MTDNELELLKLIRENDNPEKAFVTALEVILLVLKHLEPSELKRFVDSRESV